MGYACRHILRFALFGLVIMSMVAMSSMRPSFGPQDPDIYHVDAQQPPAAAHGKSAMAHVMTAGSCCACFDQLSGNAAASEPSMALVTCDITRPRIAGIAITPPESPPRS